MDSDNPGRTKGKLGESENPGRAPGNSEGNSWEPLGGASKQICDFLRPVNYDSPGRPGKPGKSEKPEPSENLGGSSEAV